jgi:Flp pilus assembly protein TadD
MHRLLLSALFLASSLLAADAPQEQARRRYDSADFEGSLQLLLQIPQKDGGVHGMIGRNHYMLGDYKKATQAFQAAIAAQPADSDHHLWLGRAYGRRAEQASPFTAPVYAGKARQNFEKAVELNSRNIEALNDLFEYYLEAPGFLGGGLDKAALLVKKIAGLDPVEAHYAQYKLAEKKGDSATAEYELRLAAAIAPEQPGRSIDLARFLAKQGRFAESEQFFHLAEKASPNQPKVLFERADTYIRGRRNLAVARDLLKRYLAAELSSDDPPRHEAEKLLRQASRS